jgi:hypothetical protein
LINVEVILVAPDEVVEFSNPSLFGLVTGYGAGTLRTLIIVVGLVRVVVALAAAGAPEVVADVLHNWPLAP